VRADRLNSIEKFAPRGLSDFIRQNLSKFPGARQDDADQPVFRPLGRPVFQSVPNHEFSYEPQVELAPYYQEHQPQRQSQLQPQTQYPLKQQSVSIAAIEEIPLPNRVLAVEWQRRQQRMVARINASLPSDCQVAAYAIVPPDLFEAEVGRFLMMAFEFYPHCFANTMFLPTSPTGAAHFGLPQHPQETLNTQRFDARSRITQLRTRVANEHGRVAAALARGDVSLLFKPNGNRPDYKQEFAAICRSVAINSFGLAAYMTHESRFNKELRDTEV
jgi:hypothetical protein